MKLALLMTVALFLSLHAIASSSNECDLLMATVGATTDSTSAYVALVKKLVFEKGAFTPESLQELSQQTSVANPLDFISRNISSDVRFAFERGFGSLKNVAWEDAQKKIEQLARELMFKRAERNEAQAQTASIFGVFETEGITSREKIPWRKNAIIPHGKHPLFTFVRDKNTYLIDINDQKMKLIQRSESEINSFLQLRDSRVLMAYPVHVMGRFEVRVIDVNSGDVLGIYQPSQEVLSRFKTALSSRMALVENREGEVSLISLLPPQERNQVVYDLKTKSEHVVELPGPITAKGRTYRSVSGDVFYSRIETSTVDPSRFWLWKFSGKSYHLLVDSLEFPFTGGSPASLNLSDGKIAFYSRNLKELVFLYSNEAALRKIKIPENMASLPIEPVEWPAGRISALLQLTSKSGNYFIIIDDTGNMKKIALPYQGLLMSKKVVLLASGESLLVIEARNFENDIWSIVFFDVDTNEVTKVDLSRKQKMNLERVYEVDGRIFSVMVDEDQMTHIVQLYGPLPEHEVVR